MDRVPKLKSGYAYRFEGTGAWKDAADDDWEIIVVTPQSSKYLGWRRIDGTRVAVFESNRAIYAQTAL